MDNILSMNFCNAFNHLYRVIYNGSFWYEIIKTFYKFTKIFSFGIFHDNTNMVIYLKSFNKFYYIIVVKLF